MEKIIAYYIIGAVLLFIGILNIRGNVSSIHRYNRRRVSEADLPYYGRFVGGGTVAIGASLFLTATVELFLDALWLDIIVAVGCAIGLALILYAQFRYNKGLF